MSVFKRYWWPGNVRELQNLIERLVAVDDRGDIEEEDLPFEYQLANVIASQPSSEGRFVDAVNTFERMLILKALTSCDWNVTGASRYLGMPLSTSEAQDAAVRDSRTGDESEGAPLVHRAPPANRYLYDAAYLLPVPVVGSVVRTGYARTLDELRRVLLQLVHHNLNRPLQLRGPCRR